MCVPEIPFSINEFPPMFLEPSFKTLVCSLNVKFTAGCGIQFKNPLPVVFIKVLYVIILKGKPTENRHFGRPMHIWEDNNRMDIRYQHEELS